MNNRMTFFVAHVDFSNIILLVEKKKKQNKIISTFSFLMPRRTRSLFHGPSRVNGQRKTLPCDQPRRRPWLTVAGGRLGRSAGALEQILQYGRDRADAIQRTGHAVVVQVMVVIVGAVRRYRPPAQLAVRSLVATRARHEVYAAVRVVVVLETTKTATLYTVIRTCTMATPIENPYSF